MKEPRNIRLEKDLWTRSRGSRAVASQPLRWADGMVGVIVRTTDHAAKDPLMSVARVRRLIISMLISSR